MPHDPKSGRVLLVGAGPGPVDLMTLRAHRAVSEAEALLYDALVSEEVVALAPRGCIRIQTGKRAGRPSMKQSTIHRLMLRLARRGLRVVRLKGGDPSIFGRSGEELDFLRAQRVPVEVVAGVTAASAAAAQFGLSLTRRGVARRLIFATARTRDGGVDDELADAARDPRATLALYMGRDSFRDVADRLVASGRSGGTPVTAIENAGWSHARSISGTLATVAAELETLATDAPVLIMVGEAARMADVEHEALGGPALDRARS